MYSLIYILSSFSCYVLSYILCKLQIYPRGANVEKKQVSFRIDPKIIKRLKFVAVELDKSLTDLFLEAIQDLLKKYEKKARK